MRRQTSGPFPFAITGRVVTAAAAAAVVRRKGGWKGGSRGAEARPRAWGHYKGTLVRGALGVNFIAQTCKVDDRDPFDYN